MPKKQRKPLKYCPLKVKGGARCGKPCIEGYRFCADHAPRSHTHQIGPTEFRGEKTVKTSEYDEYLQSDEWKEKAKRYKEENPNCSLCNRRGVLHVHHRTYVRCGKEEPLDLVVLCHECHALFHKHYKYSGNTGHFNPRKESKQ